MVEGYKVLNTKRGYRYLKDGKLTAKAKIPEEVLHRLHSDEIVKDTPNKTCVICGAYATESRFVNGQAIELCEQDFYNLNIGQIVQHLNRKAQNVTAQG